MSMSQKAPDRASEVAKAFSARTQQPSKKTPQGFNKTLPVLAVLIVSLVVVGVIACRNFSANPSFGPDTVLGSYEYDGKTVSFTVRDLSESGTVTDNLWDGKDAPDHALLRNYALWEVERRTAKDRGLDVSQKEAKAFLQEVAPDGIDAYARSMGLDADQLIARTATLLSIDALKQDVDGEVRPMPTLDLMSNASELRRQYGDCIARLLGDAWDADADTWAAQEGELYEALNWLEFSTKAASYDTAWAVWQSVSLTQGLTGGSGMTPWQKYEDELTTSVYASMTFAFEGPIAGKVE